MINLEKLLKAKKIVVNAVTSKIWGKVFKNRVVILVTSLDEGWINGGFFVLEPTIFKFIKGDKSFFEREPLQKISKLKQLYAFKHKGFWQCMDTLRDKEILEKALKSKEFK